MLDKIVLITLFAFSLGSLGQVFRISGANLYLFDIVILGANLYLFLFFLKKKKFYLNSPLILFVFFSIFSLIVTIFQTQNYLLNERLVVLSFWVRFNLYFIFSYFIYNLLVFKYLNWVEINQILIRNFYFLLMLNLIQYFLIRDISFMETYGFDPHTSRLTGFFLDPNFMGFYLVIYIFLNEFYLKSKFISFLSIWTLVLTDSRSALLSLFLFLILYAFKNLKKSILFIFFLGILFVSSNLLSRFEHLSVSNDSSALRIESWKNALYIYQNSPYFGVGFNNYRNYLIAHNLVTPANYFSNSSSYSDSSLLSVLVFTGLFGLLIYLSFLLSFVKNYTNFVLIALILFNSLIINSLFFPSLAVLIFITLNLGLLKD